MSARHQSGAMRRTTTGNRSVRSRLLQVTELESRITPDVTNLTQSTTFTWTSFGTNALIEAINAANDGDVIQLDTVGGNSYLSPGQIPVGVTLQGPNVGINPNTMTRVGEVNIDTTAKPLSIASGKSLTVDGLSFTTPNGQGALTVFATNYSVVFQNNLISNQDPVYRTVYVSTSSNTIVGYNSALIAQNRILNNSADNAAIRLSTGDNGIVRDNVIIGARNGVQINSSAGYGARNALVTNNYIENTTNEGIAIANNALNPTVTYNTIINANTSNTNRRGSIRIYGFFNTGDPGPIGDVTVTNNLISGSNHGIIFSSGPYPALTKLWINTNSITVNGGTSPFGSGTSNDATINFSGNWSGTTNPATIEADLLLNAGTNNLRNSVVQSYLTSGDNLRTMASNSNSGSWGFDPDVSKVQMQVPQTASTSGLTRVDGRIQTGIDRALPGMIVNVAADTYPESPLLNQNVTLRPEGTGTGLVGIGGGTFSQGTVEFDVNGKTAGTEFDRFVTSGSLDLTGSSFSFTLGYDAKFADFYDIVTGPNTGTFAGLPTASKVSATFNSTTYDFLITYNPDPNVIRLINIGPDQPTEVVVNEDWAGLNIGQTGFSAQFPGRIFGVTAFASIADALVYIADGGTITVAGSGANGPVNGDYAGFTLDKPVFFDFVRDTDYNEGTVTLDGPILLDGENLAITLNQTAFGAVNVASTATGTVDATSGTPAVSITSDTANTGTATLVGAIGGTGAVASFTITNLDSASVTAVTTNGAGTAISITTQNNIAAGALNAGSADVSLTSNTGAITDLNGAANNITATLLTVSAGTTIDLDTTITNLDLTSGGNGTIREADGLNINSADVSTATFDLTAGGAVTQTGPITSGSFRIVTTGGGSDVTLTDAKNKTGTLAGNVSGNLSFTNNTDLLTIGTVGASTGLTTSGTLTINTKKDLTVSEAVSGAGVDLNFGKSGVDSQAQVNAGVSSTGTLTILGGAGADLITVNAAITGTPATAAKVDGGGGTNVLTILGTSNADTFDVNKSVAKNFIARGGQAEYANFATLNLNGLDDNDTFWLGYGNFPGVGGFLPATVNIDAGGGTDDKAKIWMPAGNNNTPTTEVKVNWATSSKAVRGGETVSYNSSLELLTIEGNSGEDWFYVRPDVNTKITVNGNAPFSPPGDKLSLDVLGLTTGINTTDAKLPDGSLTGTAFAKLTWTSIESLPVPLGLGGSFDFGSITSPIQETGVGFNADPVPVPPNLAVEWIRVTGSTTFTSTGDLYGWDAPVNEFVRFTGVVNELPVGPNRDLLQDGAFWASGPANKRTFQVAVAPGGTVQVTVFSGDNAPLANTKGEIWIEGTKLDAYDVPPGKFYTNRFTVTDAGGDGIVNISFYQPQTDLWSLANAVDVRPIELIAPVYLVRDDGITSAVAADGITIDKYNFSNAQPNQTFTVTSTQGTLVNMDGSPMTDADPSLVGIQFKAKADGTASLYLRRPTVTTSALINILSAYGDSKIDGDGIGGTFAPFEQTYFVPSSPPPPTSPPAPTRLFDFNSVTNITEPGFTPVVFNQVYSPSSSGGNGVGWVGGNVEVFDRGSASSGFGGTSGLNRDGHASQQVRTFVTELNPTTTYTVTVWLGDPSPSTSRAGMTVNVGAGFGTMIGGTPTILAGSSPTAFTLDPTLPYTPVAGTGTAYFTATQTYVVSPTAGGTIGLQFTATSNSSGQLGIQLGNLGISPNYWSAQGMTFVPVSPLLPEAGFARSSTADAQKLTNSDVQPLLGEAISRWAAAGLTAEQLAQLKNVTLRVENLPGGELGFHANGQIFIDDDAAGLGWFVDATPGQDEEFLNGQGVGAAANGFDLLTVLMHELGHELGLADRPKNGPSTLMTETITPGERRAAMWSTEENELPLTPTVSSPLPAYRQQVLPLTQEGSMQAWGPAPAPGFWTMTPLPGLSSDVTLDEPAFFGVQVG